MTIGELFSGTFASIMMFQYGVFIYRSRGESKRRARWGAAYMIGAAAEIMVIILAWFTKQAFAAALFYGVLILAAVGSIIEAVVYRKRK